EVDDQPGAGHGRVEIRLSRAGLDDVKANDPSLGRDHRQELPKLPIAQPARLGQGRRRYEPPIQDVDVDRDIEVLPGSDEPIHDGGRTLVQDGPSGGIPDPFRLQILVLVGVDRTQTQRAYVLDGGELREAAQL